MGKRDLYAPQKKVKGLNAKVGKKVECDGPDAGIGKDKKKNPEDIRVLCFLVARETGLEPATSDVTGQRSNQLNYSRALSW